MQRRWAAHWLALCACAIGCSDSEGHDDGAGGSAGSIGAGGGSGLPSSRGGAGSEPLAPGCEPFEAATRAPFDACAGEPFGLWRISDLEWEARAVTFTRPSPAFIGRTDVIDCPASVLDPQLPEQLILELADGGSGRMYRTAAGHTHQYADSCATPFLGKPCEQHAEPGQCSRNCDACTCRFSPMLRVEANGDLEWQVVDSVLTLSPELNPDQVFDYCVNGDQLRLLDASGATLTLTRAFAISNPTRCEDRTLETCELGEGPNRGCRVGACVGAAGCDGASREEDCANRQGCAWDDSVCAGDPGPGCDLGQLDLTPGCELVDAQPRCVGTRTPCHDVPAEACEASDGCSFGPGCDGGAVDCGALSGACSLCDQVMGCTECSSGMSTCGGAATCLDQSTQPACEAVESLGMGRCQWVDAICRGAARPCEELGVDVCADAVGCHVERPGDDG